MNVRNEIKAQIIRAGMTMQEVVDQLAEEYGWSDSVSLPSSCCVHPGGGKANPLEQTLQGQVIGRHCKGDNHAGQQQ